MCSRDIMSSNKNTPKKSTPLRKQMHAAAPIPKTNPMQVVGAGSVIRRRINTDKLEHNSNNFSNNMLNTGFSSCTKTASASTPRIRTKSTNLNACYTPSSLFRNTRTTHNNNINNNNNRTPISSSTPGSSTPFRSAKTTISTSSSNKLKKSTSSKINNADLCADTEISNLTVAVRVRPLNAQECSRASVTNVIRVNGRNELTVMAGMAADAAACVQHTFNYDHVFYSCDPDSKIYATQEAVFAETARPLIDRAFEGYNACLFAYGQTGSGKSYSMMGIEALEANALATQAPHAESGIIPRFCHELFRRIDSLKAQLQAEIEVSYFEIYNEKIHDLLSVTNTMLQQTNSETTTTTTTTAAAARQALKVREHPIWGPYVVDLSVHPVDSYESLRNWLAVGNSQRATAATGMNDKSSRSHSIFNIVLNLTDIATSTPTASTSSDSESSGSFASAKGTVSSSAEQLPRQTRRSKISLVDLAGSERISANGNNGDRIREGVCINKSLLTLGKVIAALADFKRATNTNYINNNSTSNNQAGGATTSYGQTGNSGIFVPYRESVLTWLLRESLGGNSKTVMLATISPASHHVDETLATLRYACQARTIVNRVKVNESPHDKIIRELRAEVDRLKSLRNDYERQKRISAASGTTTSLVPRKIIIETSADESEVEALRQQLAERERELVLAQKSWMERLQEAEHQRKNELKVLRRRGLALELSVDKQQACLVNLTADPILSGILFYMLPQGKVKIGRSRTTEYLSQPDIVLDGPLVGYHHCTIENIGGILHIIPESSSEFETYLNGELVVERQQMYHGDRLVIGGSHYFRISNPFCMKPSNPELVDFQLAHQEILHKQELKLRRELEEEKRAALCRIEKERAENERNFKERLQQLELEQLKFDCNREILETERRALAVEKVNNDSNEINKLLTPTYKSTLLEDIKRIIETPSEQSLHKTQLMVKEATQRCRQLGLKVEFHQSQLLDEFGMMRTVVLIWDRERERKAEWPVARLGVWLDIVRDSEQLTAKNIFACVDINWMPLDVASNDSLNSSRISLNLSALMKDSNNLQTNSAQKITKMISNHHNYNNNNNNNSSSLIRKCFNKKKTPQEITDNGNNNNNNNSNSVKNLKNVMKKKLIYDDESDMSLLASSVNSSFSQANDLNNTLNSCSSQLNTFNYDDRECWLQLATEYVRDMQRAAMRLKRLCEHRNMILNDKENDKPSSVVMPMESTVQQMENLLQNMQVYLEQHAGHNNTEHFDNLSPNTKTPKSVRFLFD